MKVIISLIGFEVVLPPQTVYRPHALLNLAGNTVLGHILYQLQEKLTDELWIIVAETDKDLIITWLNQMAPDLEVQLIVSLDESEALAVLANNKALLDNAPVMFVSAKFIAKFDAQQLVNGTATAVHIVQNDLDVGAGEAVAVDKSDFQGAASQSTKVLPSAGIYWFRRGLDLRKLLATAVAPDATILAQLQQQPFPITTMTADLCVDTSSPQSRFHANARLLQLGFGSQDAIERSYADEFTVLPPVFIHETAVVNNAIIGPFVNIERDVVISGSIVRNSFIEAGAEIKNIILEDSFVGAGVKVNGRSQSLNLPDHPTSALS